MLNWRTPACKTTQPGLLLDQGYVSEFRRNGFRFPSPGKHACYFALIQAGRQRPDAPLQSGSIFQEFSRKSCLAHCLSVPVSSGAVLRASKRENLIMDLAVFSTFSLRSV